ncbi:MAG TPA: MBL fold metallo-hydrolase [Dongiaceae bacterium]|nr:MBL fold metallo-hydrolase [Dongiaceae bacterium]
MSKQDIDVRVISIGTLSSNPLWGEKAGGAGIRTGHSTTTLIRTGDRAILIDPGLPEPAIVARLRERSGIKPEDITHVFLTRFLPECCRGIAAFEHATWWIGQAEREGVGVPLVTRLQEAAEAGDAELKGALELDVAILKRCQPAPDNLADRVDIFPLHGVSPGLTGVLVAAAATTLVCGDAIPTVEHLERGMVLQSAADLNKARESFKEAVEIADLLVLGRDNMVVNPLRRGF